ncbi:MAG TPA: cation transporter [Ruminococcaceae bacterium]|nr:cation transporter [Oscillospiraceae bacterium]
MNKRTIGFLSGIAVFFIIYLLPLSGLQWAGHMCLALTLMTVVWWATQVAQPAYVGGIYLMLLIILGVAGPEKVFASWTGSTMWLVIGAYLIAGAAKDSGLGERIAYAFLIKFVRSYKGIIVSIFVLTFIMALLIPHPWPRAFLLMSVMTVVAKSANISKEDTPKIGLAVFAASCPLSMVFLTGDSSLNPLAVADSGVNCDFLSWFKYMSVPMIIAGILTMVLILLLFKPTREISVNVEELKEKQKSLGPFSEKEKRTAVWLVIAIALWMTDSLTGINIGWLTLIVALLMSMPVIGEVLTAKSWSGVPINVLIFLTSAIAIGTVGGATGMNAWLAKTILPSSVPTNIFLLALLIAVVSIIIHMFMGSVIAVMGVCIPAMVAYTAPMGISPLAISLMVFSAINIHYILPFHNLAMLVGCGADAGGYSQKECIKLGVPLTAVVFIVVLVEAAWFQITGLV